MKQHKQMFRHDPENGVWGDCHRTALACILNLQPAQVPHYIGEHEAAKCKGKEFDWQAAQEVWLNRLGYTSVDILFGNGDTTDPGLNGLQGLLGFMGQRNPRIYYLLGGTSPRGTNHTVVCLGGGLEWDPHPDGGFLVGPMDHGFYEVTFILPKNMKNRSNT